MKEVNSNFDVLRYLMSILIVMIHVGWSETIVITRAAVPIFFILSSYFFFSKINNKEFESQKLYYNKFLKRSIFLYLFWFVLLFPFTYFIRHWNELSFIELFCELVVSCLFKKTFPGSWYISAYILGISLAFVMRKQDKLYLIISVFCYLLCCLMSNYHGLLTYVPYSEDINILFEDYNVYNSFPAGLLFIYIGKKCSEQKTIQYSRNAAIGIVIGLILLYFENLLIEYIGERQTNDCYLSMCILAPSVFLFVKQLPHIKIIKDALVLRKMSTIYYCTNYSIIVVLNYLFKGLDSGVLFVVTLIICTLISISLIKLAKYKKFSFCKYSY